MRTIQKELGEDSPLTAEVADLRAKVADAGMPEEVEKQAQRELGRLESLPESSLESSMVRNYLEWLIEGPLVAPQRGEDRPRRGPAGSWTPITMTSTG